LHRTSEDLRPDEYQALAEFRHQIRRFLHFSEEAAQKAGLETRQHQLLLALKALTLSKGETTIGDLAEYFQRRHHSVVGMIDRLVERGFVERTRGSADKRQVFVHLTREGEEILHKLSVDHRAELRNAGPALARALNQLLRNGVGTGGVE
jgi:DNA-binding MarR family transcriptional regulator